jgi:hypothetical protein
MRGLYMNPKAFNDHLQPLLRYLYSKVGRPWDKVYSEIRALIGPNSTMQMHLLSHVQGAVEQNVRMVGKIPYRTTGGALTTSGRRNYRQLYVHPKTGLLCLAPQEKKIERGAPSDLVVFPEAPLVQYRRVTKVVGKGKGAHPQEMWLALLLETRPPKVKWNTTVGVKEMTPGRDAFFNEPLEWFGESSSGHYYGRPDLFAAKVRSVTTEELRRIQRTLGE